MRLDLRFLEENRELRLASNLLVPLSDSSSSKIYLWGTFI